MFYFFSSSLSPHNTRSTQNEIPTIGLGLLSSQLKFCFYRVWFWLVRFLTQISTFTLLGFALVSFGYSLLTHRWVTPVHRYFFRNGLAVDVSFAEVFHFVVSSQAG